MLNIYFPFTGNSNLVYTIIRKRNVFHSLANLPSDSHGITKCLSTRKNSETIRVNDHHCSHSSSPRTNISPIVEKMKELSMKKANPVDSDNDYDEEDDDEEVVVDRRRNISGVNKTTTIEEEDDDGGVQPIIDVEKVENFEICMEGSKPAQPAEPGTLKASLLDTPGEFYLSLSLFYDESQLNLSLVFSDWSND